jgi:hypothetical protein
MAIVAAAGLRRNPNKRLGFCKTWALQKDRAPIVSPGAFRRMQAYAGAGPEEMGLDNAMGQKAHFLRGGASDDRMSQLKP